MSRRLATRRRDNLQSVEWYIDFCVARLGNQERGAPSPRAERRRSVCHREVRVQRRTYVFTYLDRNGERHRVAGVNNQGWRAARRRAAAKYKELFERDCPAGFGRSVCTICGTRSEGD